MVLTRALDLDSDFDLMSSFSRANLVQKYCNFIYVEPGSSSVANYYYRVDSTKRQARP